MIEGLKPIHVKILWHTFINFSIHEINAVNHINVRGEFDVESASYIPRLCKLT